jgi:OOP family OmpA-OmpF porin
VKKIQILSFLFSGFSTLVSGQSFQTIQPAALGVHFLYAVYKNPYNSEGKDYKSGVAGLAVSYQKGISNKIELSTTVSGSLLDFFNKKNISLGNNEKLLLLEWDVSTRYKLLKTKKTVEPFIQAGLGGSYYNNYLGLYFPIGLGCQINISSSSFILINLQHRFALTTNQDNHYYFSLGFAGIVGKSNSKISKNLPATPKDTDGDGIVDLEDACPTIPGVAHYHGCPVPDRDGDGINDEKDSCPDVPGILRYKGCPIPDRDGDGINDEIDHCPDTPGILKYQGCPIPDRDGDGLNDEEDACPDVPGPISNRGCPLLTEESIKKIKKAAENCFFETGKYTLLPKSFASLNEVVVLLKNDSTILLNIEGYTDNVGKPKDNQILSENRARSVMIYLISNGVSAPRLHAQGFGQSNPVADNKSAKGRAKNRRVEIKFKTIFTSGT